MGFFDIGIEEIVVVAAVALIVFGPERLPELLGTVGKWVRTLRRLSDDVTREFQRELNIEDFTRPAYSYSPPISPPPVYVPPITEPSEQSAADSETGDSGTKTVEAPVDFALPAPDSSLSILPGSQDGDPASGTSESSDAQHDESQERPFVDANQTTNSVPPLTVEDGADNSREAVTSQRSTPVGVPMNVGSEESISTLDSSIEASNGYHSDHDKTLVESPEPPIAKPRRRRKTSPSAEEQTTL